MGWILEIVKLLVLCAATALVLALGAMILPRGTNSKAIGIDLVLHLTGARLAMVGVLNLVVGLLLTRVGLVLDAGRLHVTFR